MKRKILSKEQLISTSIWVVTGGWPVCLAKPFVHMRGFDEAKKTWLNRAWCV